jgi:aspartyl-tRNA(Asn)/glutamyl-tRNA(Gln) amidotransferase subunit A
MMSDKWLEMTACALGRGIEAGEIDPVSLTETYLAAIDANSMTPRIYVRVTADRAKAEAAASSVRAKSGQRRSLLDGVPISWKDLFDTAGVGTEAGSALLKDRVPERDACVLQNATAAGLVCLGKTHMSELAFSGLGLNPITETPPCINDRDAVAGGSSSGAAASVAHNLAASSVGSDTGGSVRIPSAWNDLVGLKTTSGLLSLEGVVPLCARFDTVGPLARSVEDAAHMLAAMEGSTPPDLSGSTLSDTRFLVLENTAQDDIEEAPLKAFNDAVASIEAAGAQVEYGTVPSIDRALPLSAQIFATEAYGTWRNEIEANPHLMYNEILKRFQTGLSVSGPDFVAAWQGLDRLRVDYLRDTAGYDAVLVPTSPIMPPNHDQLLNDSDYFVRSNLLALRNTRMGNLMGLTVLTLPTGEPSCGISLMASPFRERELLRVGRAVEDALG